MCHRLLLKLERFWDNLTKTNKNPREYIFNGVLLNSLHFLTSYTFWNFFVCFLLKKKQGFRIVGGKPNPLQTNQHSQQQHQQPQLSAFIVRVRSGSVADVVGRLQAGDEVVKWNRTCLRGLTYDDVYSVMSRSRGDAQVELVVERILK